MITINVYNDIESNDPFLSLMGFENMAFNADTVLKVFSENPAETDFKFNINCNGGSVSEGLRIYDVLRTSGKNIYCNIENSCHSMAIVLLLAAPKQNRTANQNARALIHKVRGDVSGVCTADEILEIAGDMIKEEKAILDIYENRTGTERAILEMLMREEKQRTAQELKKYGFISKINTYNTNKLIIKNHLKMAEKVTLKNRIADWLKNTADLLKEVQNYDFTDEDGNVLFSTTSETDTIEVGMEAAPDGEFLLPNGQKVIIADGVITEITTEEEEEEELTEVENLTEENTQLKAQLAQAQNLINEMNNKITSNYNPSNRNRSVAAQKRGNTELTKQERKAKILENYNKVNNSNSIIAK